MGERTAALLLATALGGIGVVILWRTIGHLPTLGVFLMLAGNNIGERLQSSRAPTPDRETT